MIPRWLARAIAYALLGLGIVTFASLVVYLLWLGWKLACPCR